MIALGGAGAATGVQVAPFVRVTEMITDNAGLRRAGGEVDAITQISPGLQRRMRGERGLAGSLIVAQLGTTTASATVRRMRPTWRSTARANHGPENCPYVDLLGSVSRQSAYSCSVRGPLTRDGYQPDPGERMFSISPYFTSVWGNTGSLQFRAIRIHPDSDSTVAMADRSPTNSTSPATSDPYALGSPGLEQKRLRSDQRQSELLPAQEADLRPFHRHLRRRSGSHALRLIGGCGSPTILQQPEQLDLRHGRRLDADAGQRVTATVEDRFSAPIQPTGRSPLVPDGLPKLQQGRQFTTSGAMLAPCRLYDLLMLQYGRNPVSRPSGTPRSGNSSRARHGGNVIVGCPVGATNATFSTSGSRVGATYVGPRPLGLVAVPVGGTALSSVILPSATTCRRVRNCGRPSASLTFSHQVTEQTNLNASFRRPAAATEVLVSQSSNSRHADRQPHVPTDAQRQPDVERAPQRGFCHHRRLYENAVIGSLAIQF